MDDNGQQQHAIALLALQLAVIASIIGAVRSSLLSAALSGDCCYRLYCIDFHGKFTAHEASLTD